MATARGAGVGRGVGKSNRVPFDGGNRVNGKRPCRTAVLQRNEQFSSLALLGVGVTRNRGAIAKRHTDRESLLDAAHAFDIKNGKALPSPKPKRKLRSRPAGNITPFRFGLEQLGTWSSAAPWAQDRINPFSAGLYEFAERRHRYAESRVEVRANPDFREIRSRMNASGAPSDHCVTLVGSGNPATLGPWHLSGAQPSSTILWQPARPHFCLQLTAPELRKPDFPVTNGTCSAVRSALGSAGIWARLWRPDKLRLLDSTRSGSRLELVSESEVIGDVVSVPRIVAGRRNSQDFCDGESGFGTGRERQRKRGAG